MPSAPLELFLLSANISQARDRDAAARLFVEGLGSIFPGVGFSLIAAPGGAGPNIEVCTRSRSFGRLAASGPVAEDDLALLENAAQMLAIVLEKLEQEALLVERNRQLERLAAERAELMAGLEARVRERTAELARSEADFKAIFEKAAVGYCLTAPDGRLLKVNPAFASLLGYSVEELQRLDFRSLTHPDDLAPSAAVVRALLAGDGDSRDFEKRYLHRDGRVVWTWVFSSLARGPGGEPLYFITSVVDVRAKKLAEQTLRDSEERQRLILETLDDQVMTVDADLRVRYLNHAPEGAAAGALGAEPLPQAGPDGRAELRRTLGRTLATGEPGEIECGARDGAGREAWYRVRTARLPGGARQAVLVASDVTAAKRSAAAIGQALQEKETLLRELYHRTKNNMAVIDALLELQAADEDKEGLREAFAEARNRIRTMALVHQKLYDSRDLSRINLRDYLGDLAQLLLDGYAVGASGVALSLELADAEVLIDSAMPVGLIVNELVSNALKHAFPAGRNGSLSIRLRAEAGGGFELTVADDGVGLPPGFDPRRDGRLGLQSVFSLAEGQLQGRADCASGPGTSWRVGFRECGRKARV
jgi:PAS domain S-box-containing protein